MVHHAVVIHRLRLLKNKLNSESLKRHRVLPVMAFSFAACIALGGLTISHADQATPSLPLPVVEDKPVVATDAKSDPEGVRFEANVVDSITGKPVEGFVLYLRRDMDVVAKSDAQGRIVIDNLKPGQIRFQCGGGKPLKPGKWTFYRHGPFGRWWSPDAIEPRQRKQIRAGLQRNFDYLEFDLSLDMEPITIVVEQGVTLTGRVFDPNGNPVVGATVAPARTGSGNSITGDTRYSVRTNKDGRYRLVLPASGAVKYNLIAHDGKFKEWRNWGNGVSGAFMTKPGEVIDNKDIRLSETATVHGFVVDTDGNPVPDHEVRLVHSDGQCNRYYVPSAVTDKSGQFVVKFARPGKQHIQAMYFFRNDGGPGGRKFGPVIGPVWSGNPEEGPSGTAQLIDLRVGENARDLVLVVDFDPR